MLAAREQVEKSYIKQKKDSHKNLHQQIIM